MGHLPRSHEQLTHIGGSPACHFDMSAWAL
jgi:hypothetical protein